MTDAPTSPQDAPFSERPARLARRLPGRHELAARRRRSDAPPPARRRAAARHARAVRHARPATPRVSRRTLGRARVRRGLGADGQRPRRRRARRARRRCATSLVVTSTYGEGEMPDNAELFWEALPARHGAAAGGPGFGVLALGDTGYDGYCQAGKLIDTRLEQLGANRVIARVDCDVDYEEPAAAWTGRRCSHLARSPRTPGRTACRAAAPETTGRTRSQWTRKNPYASTLAVNRLLSGPRVGEGDPALRVRPRRQRHRVRGRRRAGVDAEERPGAGRRDRGPTRCGSGDAAIGGRAAQPNCCGTGYEIRTPSKDSSPRSRARAGTSELAHVLRARRARRRWTPGCGARTCSTCCARPSATLTADEFVGLLQAACSTGRIRSRPARWRTRAACT